MDVVQLGECFTPAGDWAFSQRFRHLGPIVTHEGEVLRERDELGALGHSVFDQGGNSFEIFLDVVARTHLDAGYAQKGASLSA